jgi:hypothetical protein
LKEIDEEKPAVTVIVHIYDNVSETPGGKRFI